MHPTAAAAPLRTAAFPFLVLARFAAWPGGGNE